MEGPIDFRCDLSCFPVTLVINGHKSNHVPIVNDAISKRCMYVHVYNLPVVIYLVYYQINTYCYLQCHGAIFKSNSKINQAEKIILIFITALPALFQPRRNFFMQLHIEFDEGSTTFWLLILPINLKALKHHVFSSCCNGTQHEMLVQPWLCYNNLITSSH